MCICCVLALLSLTGTAKALADFASRKRQAKKNSMPRKPCENKASAPDY